jgi:hypothetical protein
MSVYRLNKIMYLLETEPAFLKAVRANPAGALADIDLTDEERKALLAGDVGAMYLMGVHPFLMHTLSRQELFGLDRNTYLQRVRAAAERAAANRGDRNEGDDDNQ